MGILSAEGAVRCPPPSAKEGHAFCKQARRSRL